MRYLSVRHSKNRRHADSIGCRLLGAAATVAVATAFVQLIQAGKEVAVAYHFGTGAALEAFLLAYLFPSYLVNAVGGSMPAAFVPVFVRARESRGEKAAAELLMGVTVMGSLFLAIMSLLLGFVGSYALPFVGSGFSAPNMGLSLFLFKWLLPLIPLQGLVAIWTAGLNAMGSFAFPAVLPVVPALTTLVCLFVLPSVLGAKILLLGAVSGIALQFLLLGLFVREKGLFVRPVLHHDLGEVFHQYWPIFLGSFFIIGNTVTDQAMAARLPGGALAALGYGDRLVSALLGLTSMAIGTVILPHFSELAAKGAWQEIKRVFYKYNYGLGLFFSAVAVGFFLFSGPIVRLLWERGNFTVSDASLTAQIQAFYALRIPFYLCAVLQARLFSSLGKNHILLIVAGVDFCSNIVFNLILMRFLGGPGLALSTSAVCCLSFIAKLFIIRAMFLKYEASHGQVENVS